MDSLSPKCTTLKRRYDSCFNAWFEGYLQPALDTSSPNRVFGASVSDSTPAHTPPSSSSSWSNSESNVQNPRIATSWSAAIGRRPPFANGPATQPRDSSLQPIKPSAEVVIQQEVPDIDIRGKTRAQIKAAEYERNCGAVWKEYQACLQIAIAENQSLSNLLEAARDEHVLPSLDSIKGTPWDPDTRIE